MKKFFEFYEAKKGYFVSVLAMYSIVMSFGVFGDIPMGIGAFVAFACAIAKEAYDAKVGGKFSALDLGICLAGIVIGLIMSLLGNIA